MKQGIIGLTGGIGSGKTQASEYFKTLGIDVIDADVIARKVVSKGSDALKKIAEYFGNQAILDDGHLNRGYIREKIFQSNDSKLWLESLTHPLIREQIVRAIDQSKSSYCVLVAPLLLEGDLHETVDKIVVVDCDESTQIQRASHRDGRSADNIQAIMNNQITRSERLKHADYVLNNSSTPEHLYQQIHALHQQLLEHYG